MKKIFILTSIITLSLGLTAQNTSSFEWAKSVSSSTNVDVRDIAVDSQGNSYITGGFVNTASFGTTTLTSTDGSENVFIAKIDNLGNFIWAKSAGSNGGDRGNSIAVDAQGNSYITGKFGYGGAVFGDTTLFLINSTASFFITKLDNSGNFIWAKSVHGGFTYNTHVNGIAIDSIGNSYIVGRAGAVSFGASPAISGIFIAKLDASGNDFEWAKQIGEYAQFIDGHDIALDSQGNPHITGRFEGTMSFGDTTLISSETGNFIAKLDATGNYIWVRKVGNDTWFHNRIAIAIDSQDNSHAVGRFQGSIPFGDTTLVSNGVNGYITKLDMSGQFIWARKMNGNYDNFVSVEAIAIDAQGNSYIAGEFSGSSLAGTIGLTVYGGDDVFIAKLNTLGVFEWVKSAGSNVSDELRGIAVDAQGNSYITGVYKNTATFGAFSLTSVGSEDAFIAKISEGALSSIENYEFETVTIYPNPTNSFLFIESETPIEKLIIRDLSGKIVYQSSNSIEEKVGVQNLNSGIYLLEIMFENIRIIKKFVKD